MEALGGVDRAREVKGGCRLVVRKGYLYVECDGMGWIHT